MANGPYPSVDLYWYEDVDPTIAPGIAAPLKQLLIRTDTTPAELYYKSGLGDTDWTLIGVGSGGGGGGAQFGSAIDGDLVFDGVSIVTGTGFSALSLTPIANVYTLTRDLFADSLTLDAGVFIEANGFRIFARGTATINGTIRCNGGVGGVGAINAGGAGGAPAIGASRFYGETTTGANGGASGSGGASSVLGPSTAIFGLPIATLGPNLNGGLLQGGGGGDGNGGNGGSVTSFIAAAQISPGPYILQQAISGRTNPITAGANGQWMTGLSGAGGAGAGGANNGGGGGGGAAGGTVFIAARTIVGVGSLLAVGGDGGAAGNIGAGSTNGGGGGGSGGFTIVVTSSAFPLSVGRSVVGGAGGAGNGTGQPGGAGGPGLSIDYSV